MFISEKNQKTYSTQSIIFMSPLLSKYELMKVRNENNTLSLTFKANNLRASLFLG